MQYALPFSVSERREMTNEEAVKIIMEVQDNYDVNAPTSRRIYEAMSMAIWALKVKPIVRCKDCSLWCICHHGDNWFCTNGTPINTASDFYDDKGHLLIDKAKFCPYCGARMDEVEE
jgi:hypothetical protein